MTPLQGHFIYLLGHIVDDTKLPLVACFKTSSVSPFMKLSSIPNAGILL